jgi:hypothetical protein
MQGASTSTSAAEPGQQNLNEGGRHGILCSPDLEPVMSQGVTRVGRTQADYRLKVI